MKKITGGFRTVCIYYLKIRILLFIDIVLLSAKNYLLKISNFLHKNYYKLLTKMKKDCMIVVAEFTLIA